MTEYMVRFAHQCGVGLDPYKDRPGRLGKKWLRYWKGGVWYGGPQTATHFKTLEEAQAVVDGPQGHTHESGEMWLGHVWPCEVVAADQAFKDEESQ